MGAIELLLGVAFTVAVGTGVALTLSAETFLEFWGARACYAVAATFVLSSYAIWLNRDCERPLSSVLRRWSLGVVSFVTSFIIAVGGIGWTNGREKMSAEADMIRDGARLDMTDMQPAQGADGKFTFPVMIENKGKYPITGWVMSLTHKTSIRRLDRVQENAWASEVADAFNKANPVASVVDSPLGNSIDVGTMEVVRDPKFRLNEFNVDGIKSGNLNLYVLVLFKYADSISVSHAAAYYQVHCSWYDATVKSYSPCIAGYNFRRLER